MPVNQNMFAQAKYMNEYIKTDSCLLKNHAAGFFSLIHMLFYVQHLMKMFKRLLAMKHA
jgi:hypothetical protein